MLGLRRQALVVEPARRGPEGLVVRLRLGWSRPSIAIRVHEREPGAVDDPFVPIGLLLGMATGRDVVVEGPVSEPLLASLDAVRADLAAWYPELHRPAFRAAAPVPAPPRAAGAQGIASFFSGGLDSFYTAITHAQDITHLVFVHGFDVRLADTKLRHEVASRTAEAASELGKPLLQVETDLRSVSDGRANWAWFNHAGLIAVALELAPGFDEVLVPATLADAHRPPELRGRIDRETWATSGCRIRTDGAEATRPEKARVVAEQAAARSHLRVCWENRGGAYNCGHCPKCVRTLLDLEVAGVRERFASFPPGWDPTWIRDIPMPRRSERQFLEECLWMAEAEGRQELAELLQARIARGP